MSGAKKMHMFHLPLLRVDGYKPSFLFLLFKRIFDILSSGIAIILTSPVMLITAIAGDITEHSTSCGENLSRVCVFISALAGSA